MPRQPRQFGNSGYMHLIVRGIGKQILFENQDDYSFFLAILRRFSTETSVSILAYCLMENHVHLLVHDEQHHSPLLMKKIGVSYSRYFNRKYKRSGHLLQDRYRSEPIETDGSLIRVFRYILNNPEGAETRTSMPHFFLPKTRTASWNTTIPLGATNGLKTSYGHIFPPKAEPSSKATTAQEETTPCAL